MFGLFSLFGASAPQRRLDAALREVGVHPRLVPGAVKITVLRQIKASERDTGAHEAACADAAQLLGYLMHGAEVFAEDNGAWARSEAEDRVAAAIGAGDSADARLILLALHAGIVTPEVIEEYQLEAD